MRLYADSTRCSGCRACLVACSLNLFGENNPKKAALALIPHFPESDVYEVKVCTQCGNCAAVCPKGAIKRNHNGAYYVDYSECDLCEACVVECPENVMYVRVDLADHSWKCDLCGDCVTVCDMSVLRVAETESMTE